jgi:hypothetical protein
LPLSGFALHRFERVATHDLDLSVTRSFGYRTKFSVSPSFNRRDRYNDGGIASGSAAVRRELGHDPGPPILDERLDNLLGATLSLYQYDYKTVQNFRNLKWSETLETGWRLSTKAALNQEWMGARNGDLYLSHSAVFNDAWWDALFLNSGASLRYYVSGAGEFDDGYGSFFGELQWKPVAITSSFFSASWAHLFASEKSQQLLLGEDSGLNGYPSFYYAGQARLLLEAEQRFFPPFEVSTLVPALAVFANAGNTFQDYEEFDPGDLHYSLGMGLRLGASKTVQKIVYHINLSSPLDGELQRGSVWDKVMNGFSIRAKTSL